MTLAEIKSELEKAYNEEDWNRIETLIDNLEIAIQIFINQKNLIIKLMMKFLKVKML